jgi:hypothetical protein
MKRVLGKDWLIQHVNNAMYRWYPEEIVKRIQDHCPDRTDLIEYFNKPPGGGIWYRDEILAKLKA